MNLCFLPKKNWVLYEKKAGQVKSYGRKKFFFNNNISLQVLIFFQTKRVAVE